MELEAAKERICDEVERRADLLLEISQQIHARPELGFEEHFAHDLLASALESEGLTTTRGAFGLDTALAAEAGDPGAGRRTVAVLCEYDALPGLGHACGHNVIAAAGLGAGLAAASVAGELGGRVLVLGCPAEEGGGGKILMARAGAFEGVDAALMVHPADAELVAMSTLAVQVGRVTYKGEAAHAAAFPHRGRNALDAAVLGYMGVAALRQHIRPEERVHGVFISAGERPNVVPDHAEAEWYVRTGVIERLDELRERVQDALAGGALAAGCEMEVRWDDRPYAELVSDVELVDLYVANAGRLGRQVSIPEGENQVLGSTDMGNVSHLVPSIHPMIQVAPAGVGIHTPEFASYAASEAADEAVLDGAKALAMTIADVWLRP